MASSKQLYSSDNFKSHDKSDFNTRLSMKLSGILRHGKDGFKRHIDQNGWLEISTLLRNSHFCQDHRVTHDQIVTIVESNDKQRYKISDDGTRIKANQGHTLGIKDESLQKISLDDAASYSAVVHGTYYKVYNLILKNGLSRMKRNHIHLTASDCVDSSIGVVSGFRGSCELLVYIDMCRAIQDGHEFFVSENNVILCPGNEEGYLESKYFLKVYDRNSRELIHNVCNEGNEGENLDTEVADERHKTLKKEVGKIRKKLKDIEKIENNKGGKLDKEQLEKLGKKDGLKKELDKHIAELKEIAGSKSMDQEGKDQEKHTKKEDCDKEVESEKCHKLRKQICKLRKKISDIEELEAEVKNGKELEKTQLEKIQKKGEMNKEIETLMVQLREMGESVDPLNTSVSSDSSDVINQSNNSTTSNESRKEKMSTIQKEMRKVCKKLKDIKSINDDLNSGKKTEKDLDNDMREKISRREEHEKTLDELTSELELLNSFSMED